MERKIVEQVAKEFNLPEQTITRIYTAWMNYIKNTMRNTEYSEDMEQVGFIIPSLGKIYVNKKKLPYIFKNKRNGRTKTEEDTSKKQLDNNDSNEKI